jgi:hypothetical protein
MLRPIDQYSLSREEPAGSCLRFLREHILSIDPDMKESLAYGMPFYHYRTSRCCYLWTHKKSGMPYIGFVDGNRMDEPDLISEQRSRMKIFLIDPGQDLPMDKIERLLRVMLSLYQHP